jgi:hypothetical protein
LPLAFVIAARVSDQSYIYQMPFDIASASLSKDETRTLMAGKEKPITKAIFRELKSEPSLPRSNNEPRGNDETSS